MKFRLFVPSLLLGIAASAAFAQSPGVQSIADREIQRQEAMAKYAESSIEKGQKAMAANDFESAFSYYRAAVDALPSGGSAVAGLRQEALEGLGNASIQLARQRISEGRMEDARTTVAFILEDRYLPDYKPALDLQKQLNDPGRFDSALTPNFIANVEEVKQLLREAEGFYQSGRFDLAVKRYEQVLNIDPYNIAARRGMEEVDNQRSDYAAVAYNEARSDMLADVSRAWELPVRRFDTQASTIIEQPKIDIRGTASVNRKLDDIIIPRIDFNDASIREALEFLRQRAAALDTSETDPSRKGTNIVLKLPPGAPEESVLINLSLSDVPLRAAIDYVARAANMKLKVEPFAVVIVPESETTDVLITKEYKVSPGFITNIPDGGDGGGTVIPGGGGVSTTAPRSLSAIAERSGARQFLESQGVTFPTGASAIFLPSSSRLIVKNTQGNRHRSPHPSRNRIQISRGQPKQSRRTWHRLARRPVCPALWNGGVWRRRNHPGRSSDAGNCN